LDEPVAEIVPNESLPPNQLFHISAIYRFLVGFEWVRIPDSLGDRRDLFT
jgi:hypothetical protein